MGKQLNIPQRQEAPGHYIEINGTFYRWEDRNHDGLVTRDELIEMSPQSSGWLGKTFLGLVGGFISLWGLIYLLTGVNILR